MILWVVSWAIVLANYSGLYGKYIAIIYPVLVAGSFFLKSSGFEYIAILWTGLVFLSLSCVFAISGTNQASAEFNVLTTARKWEMSQDLYLILLTILPQNILSRMFGWVAATPLPRFMREPILLSYSRSFGVTVEEAEKEIKEYGSLNLFFTRNLKPGARPIEGDERTVVSPVDGTVMRFGEINDGQMIQAKAISYSLEDMLESPEYSQKFMGGRFLVIYLSPRDYHKIHFPVGGDVPAYTYVPGDLFTVNPIAVERLHALFSKNERLTTYIQNPQGWVALVKVGATNVGRIKLEYDKFVTNRWFRFRVDRSFSPVISAKRGDELGRFEMGSTVVLLFEKGTMDFLPVIREQAKLKFGQAIGRFVS